MQSCIAAPFVYMYMHSPMTYVPVCVNSKAVTSPNPNRTHTITHMQNAATTTHTIIMAEEVDYGGIHGLLMIVSYLILTQLAELIAIFVHARVSSKTCIHRSSLSTYLPTYVDHPFHPPPLSTHSSSIPSSFSFYRITRPISILDSSKLMNMAPSCSISIDY